MYVIEKISHLAFEIISITIEYNLIPWFQNNCHFFYIFVSRFGFEKKS